MLSGFPQRVHCHAVLSGGPPIVSLGATCVLVVPPCVVGVVVNDQQGNGGLTSDVRRAAMFDTASLLTLNALTRNGGENYLVTPTDDFGRNTVQLSDSFALRVT